MSALVGAELLKLRTTRAPFVLALAALALAAVAVSGTIGAGLLDEGQRALELAGAAAFSTFFATLLGILIVTNEYRHGTITQTLLVTPRRLRVVTAKLLVGTLGGLALGALGAVVTLAIALPWLSTRGHLLAVDGELAEALARLLVAFAVSGALGVALGALLRSQVWAIATVFVWFLIVEPLLTLAGYLVDRDRGDRIVQPYLPGSALEAITSIDQDDVLLAWPLALLLSIGYVAVLAVLAAFLVTRRDAA